MTDAEMVKAMEICKDKEIPCDDCPLVECGDCEGISRQYFYDRFKQLQSENAELKSSLTHANEECLKWHERAQNLLKDSGGSISGYEKKISDLQSENAALRERLGKAVELPCSVGTTVYGVGFFDCEDAYTEDEKKKRKIFNYCMKMNGDCEKCKYRRPSIEEFVCTHIQIGACGLGGQKILIVGEKNENYTGGNIYLTREAAEARLVELKGEKK